MTFLGSRPIIQGEMLGSIGFPEILMILVIALLIFGPKKLPEVGRTIGKGLAEFRRASSDLKRSVNAELALDDEERQPTPRRPAVADRTLGDTPPGGPGFGPDADSAPAPKVTVAPENTAARGSLDVAEEAAPIAPGEVDEADETAEAPQVAETARVPEPVAQSAEAAEAAAPAREAAEPATPASKAAEPAPADDAVATH